MTENRRDGKRQIAAAVYPLTGVTVLVNTQVAKVLITQAGNGSLIAHGVRLANDTEIHAGEVIIAAGGSKYPIKSPFLPLFMHAKYFPSMPEVSRPSPRQYIFWNIYELTSVIPALVHTPQLLMLSGIGPAEELEKHGIEVKLDAPDVGQNFADHLYTVSSWNVADPDAGWAYGSPGYPTAARYGWGAESDFIVSTGIRDRAGLMAAIEADEGVAPDAATHPLLAEDRVFFEHIFNNQGATDGSAVAVSSTNLLPTSRGSIRLSSADISDAPLADPNYLATEVDRFVFREGLRLEIDFLASNKTVLATQILDGEIVPEGFSEGYSVSSTDSYLDARVRAGLK